MKPKAYDLEKDEEIYRLHKELLGYMKVSLRDGTDFEGRKFAVQALETIVKEFESDGRYVKPK